jgi:hypothetical protein
MNGTDFSKASRLIRAVEEDMRNFLIDPSNYQSMFFEDVHAALIEAMELLGIEVSEHIEVESQDLSILEEAQDIEHAKDLENYDRFNQISMKGEI